MNRITHAEALLGTINWLTDTKGHCRCPGEADHSTETGATDTIVYTDGVPTIFCHHQSCADAVEAANKALREAILNGDTDDQSAIEKEAKRHREEVAQER